MRREKIDALCTLILLNYSGILQDLITGMAKTISSLQRSGEWVEGTQVIPQALETADGRVEYRYTVLKPRGYNPQTNIKQTGGLSRQGIRDVTRALQAASY